MAKIKVRKLKRWGVFLGVQSTYTPADYLGAHTIFRTKKMAEYWRDTRVHSSMLTKIKIVPVEIVYKL